MVFYCLFCGVILNIVIVSVNSNVYDLYFYLKWENGVMKCVGLLGVDIGNIRCSWIKI